MTFVISNSKKVNEIVSRFVQTELDDVTAGILLKSVCQTPDEPELNIDFVTNVHKNDSGEVNATDRTWAIVRAGFHTRKTYFISIGRLKSIAILNGTDEEIDKMFEQIISIENTDKKENVRLESLRFQPRYDFLKTLV